MNLILNTKKSEQIQFDLNHDEYKYTINSFIYNVIWITHDLNKFIHKNGKITYSKKELNGKLLILGSIKKIDEKAFYECYNLKTVIIGNSVKIIGDYAFSKCENLTSITIPNSVKTIGICAFWGCINLTSITISDSIETIDISAFSECDNLETITIIYPPEKQPNKITNLNYQRKFKITGLSNKVAFIWEHYTE